MECMLVLRGVSGLWSLRWAQEPVLIGNGERLSLHPPQSWCCSWLCELACLPRSFTWTSSGWLVTQGCGGFLLPSGPFPESEDCWAVAAANVNLTLIILIPRSREVQ